MKKLLTLGWQRLVESKPVSEGEVELSHHLDLLIPVSQLYGIEFHPSVYRYYER